MATIKKEIKLTAQSKTDDGSIIATFTGSINTEDPNKISYNPVITNQSLYKENRVKVKEEQEEFENVLYEEQEKMMEQAKEEAE